MHFSEKYKEAFLEDLASYEEEMRWTIANSDSPLKAFKELEETFKELRERFDCIKRAVLAFDDDGAMVGEMAREYARAYKELVDQIFEE